jgi:hypothetical protein
VITYLPAKRRGKLLQLDEIACRWPEFQQSLSQRKFVRGDISSKQDDAAPVVVEGGPVLDERLAQA